MIARVQKIIADAGICSRRKAEDLIRLGSVTVNGKTAKIGDSADSDKDTIAVDGKPLKKTSQFLYLAINKPRGFVSSTLPENGREAVTSLVKTKERIYPVGRLDVDTEGLLLLTNDGNFSHKLTHPSFEVTKTYQVHLLRPIREKDLLKLQDGPVIDGKKVDIHMVRDLEPRVIEVTIHEGRKHIVKKLFGHMGYHVERLIRIRIGDVQLGPLRTGAVRALTPVEIQKLLKGVKKEH